MYKGEYIFSEALFERPLLCTPAANNTMQRSSIKLTDRPPAKRARRSVSTTSSTSSMDLAQSSSDSSLPQRTRRVGDGLDCRYPTPAAGSSNNPIDLSNEDDDNDDNLAILMRPSRPASRPRQQDQSFHRVQAPSRGPRYPQQIINEIINVDAGANTGREEHLRRHQAAVLPDYRHSFHLPSINHSARHTPAPIHPHNETQARSRHAGRGSEYQSPANAPILVIDDDEEDDDNSFIVEDGYGNRMPMFSNDEAAMIRNRLSGRTPVTGVNGAREFTAKLPTLPELQIN